MNVQLIESVVVTASIALHSIHVLVDTHPYGPVQKCIEGACGILLMFLVITSIF